MDFDPTDDSQEFRVSLWLWAGIALGPIAWAAHLQSVYAAAAQVCVGDIRFKALHLASAACLAVAALGLILAVSLWRRELASSSAQAEGPSPKRRYFMAIEGAMIGSLSIVLILAQWTALIYLSPCPA